MGFKLNQFHYFKNVFFVSVDCQGKHDGLLPWENTCRIQKMGQEKERIAEDFP